MAQKHTMPATWVAPGIGWPGAAESLFHIGGAHTASRQESQDAGIPATHFTKGAAARDGHFVRAGLQAPHAGRGETAHGRADPAWRNASFRSIRDPRMTPRCSAGASNPSVETRVRHPWHPAATNGWYLHGRRCCWNGTAQAAGAENLTGGAAAVLRQQRGVGGLATAVRAGVMRVRVAGRPAQGPA